VRGRGGDGGYDFTGYTAALAAAIGESAVVASSSAGRWLQPTRDDGGGCRRFCLFRAWAWSWRDRRLAALG
jgi:hypothetical protein